MNQIKTMKEIFMNPIKTINTLQDLKCNYCKQLMGKGFCEICKWIDKQTKQFLKKSTYPKWLDREFPKGKWVWTIHVVSTRMGQQMQLMYTNINVQTCKFHITEDECLQWSECLTEWGQLVGTLWYANHKVIHGKVDY